MRKQDVIKGVEAVIESMRSGAWTLQAPSELFANNHPKNFSVSQNTREDGACLL